MYQQQLFWYYLVQIIWMFSRLILACSAGNATCSAFVSVFLCFGGVTSVPNVFWLDSHHDNVLEKSLDETDLSSLLLLLKINLAKLGDGLNESPTVMVGDKKQKTTVFGKNRGILKPSWTFVKTNKTKATRILSHAHPFTNILLRTLAQNILHIQYMEVYIGFNLVRYKN